MSMKLVQSFSGTGKIRQGDTVVANAAPYNVEVYQKILEGGIPGLKTVLGAVKAPLAFGQQYSLVTREGYTVDFFVSDSAGSVRFTGAITDDKGVAVA